MPGRLLVWCCWPHMGNGRVRTCPTGERTDAQTAHDHDRPAGAGRTAADDGAARRRTARTWRSSPASSRAGPTSRAPTSTARPSSTATSRIKLKAPRALLYGKWNDELHRGHRRPRVGQRQAVAGRGRPARRRSSRRSSTRSTPCSTPTAARSPTPTATPPKPTIEVYDLEQNDEVAVNAFASLPNLLDFDEGLVVASFFDFKVRTITWDTVADETVKVNSRRRNYASMAHDLLGLLQQGPVQRRLPGARPPQRPDRRVLDQLRRADRRGLARRQAGGDHRAAQRRHRPRRRDGAQDRRRARSRTTPSTAGSAGSGGRPRPSC